MHIGAHVSSAGGIQKVFERAAAIRAEAIQLFPSAPQQWKTPNISDQQADAFREGLSATQLPVFFHGVYLVNLASADDALIERSVDSLTGYLDWAGRLGVRGVIFHVGSHLGRGWDDALVAQICALMRRALDGAPNDALLVIENNAGQGNCVGATFAEIGAMIRGLDNDPRLAVCLDTCHALAMGYDIATTDGCHAAMQEFDHEIGLARLVAVHANDSKMPLGGTRDRHENIGEGHIGLEGFGTIMRHPAFRDVPFFLEVPGLDGKGPDIENIMRLKAIRAGASIPAPTFPKERE